MFTLSRRIQCLCESSKSFDLTFSWASRSFAILTHLGKIHSTLRTLSSPAHMKHNTRAFLVIRSRSLDTVRIPIPTKRFHFQLPFANLGILANWYSSKLKEWKLLGIISARNAIDQSTFIYVPAGSCRCIVCLRFFTMTMLRASGNIVSSILQRRAVCK